MLLPIVLMQITGKLLCELGLQKKNYNAIEEAIFLWKSLKEFYRINNPFFFNCLENNYSEIFQFT